MNIVKRAFSISTEEYELRRHGKIPKKSLEEFLKELDLDKENND
jgi:hypothetical protein